MILVCDTGPPIALAKIDRLDLLSHLGFQRICLPPWVHRELLGKVGPESEAVEAALAGFIQITQPGPIDPRVQAIVAHLDRGEREVILVGASLTDRGILLLDDQAGRPAAKALGLAMIGTAGVLLSAKKRGLIDVVSPLMSRLRQQGYWLSEALVAEVRRLAGEQDS